MRRSLWRIVLLFFKDDVFDLSQSYKLFDFNNLWNCQTLGLWKKLLFCNINICGFNKLILS